MLTHVQHVASDPMVVVSTAETTQAAVYAVQAGTCLDVLQVSDFLVPLSELPKPPRPLFMPCKLVVT